MTLTSAEANFSELIQKPKDTVARMQETPRKGITLHRRDDEDLYLTTAARAAAAAEVVDSTTRMFVALMKSDPKAADMLTRVFPEAFPWVRFLPDAAVRKFLIEFMETARAASDLGTVAPLAPLIAAWKSTAEIHADPELRARLLESAEGDLGPVEAPTAEAE
ncbi:MULTISPECIES: hypothetical protein [unclassified Streptomyces]|uniref:hypothetical protein n=1 Tax=unclassified Streptomyces TaxID=2593676 RepID=UPI002E28FA29|nr:hypothetical protein [Streptomyces sp. NBC_01423]WSX92174.1 hypothetical protein OH827_17250 [Streptomyces sp. NBC_00891]WSY06651.1 hypothetical protein OG464_17250 [Streptomyces sp. NBC_00890]WSZ08275.1 hypothetical protein OG704_17250 [Streptomyces sp. NBC_00869]WSZ24226.1 hypothetical protein OG498_16315 [Streptomyces sp. NBC_00870]